MVGATPEIRKLKDRLRGLSFAPGQVKVADGDSQQQPFEIAFSNLAHAYAKDRMPGLQGMEVGFQLLSKTDDNTKAVGVTGYQLSGSQWIYAPVFFLNGQLKGSELLFLKSQDQFTCSSEEWVDYLLGRAPHVLGQSVNRNMSQLGVQPPSLYQLSRSPAKFASAKDLRQPRLASWAKEAMPYLAKAATQDPLKDPKYADLPDLPTFLEKAGRDTFKAFLNLTAQYPGIMQGFDNIHGPTRLTKVAQVIAANERKANSVLRTKAATTPQTQTGSILKTAKAKKEPKVKHVTMDEVMVNGRTDLIKDLSAMEKEKLLREKILFTDTRDDQDITIAYNVQTQLRLRNPDNTGIYEVLVRPDKFETCLVLKAPYSDRGRQPFATVIRLAEPRNWLNAHVANLFISGEMMMDGWDKWFEGLEDAKLPKEGDYRESFVILGPTGQATVPFHVREYFEGDDVNDDYRVSFDDYARDNPPAYVADHREYDPYEEGCCMSSQRSHIIFDKHTGPELRLKSDGLHIPVGFKVLKVKEQREEENPPINPGNLVDVQTVLMGHTEPMQITSSGMDVTIDGTKRVDKQAALIYLVEEKGLREKAARYILKQAENKPFKCLLKKAGLGDTPGDMVSSAPNGPGFPEPNIGYDPMTGGNIPTQQMYESQQPVADMSAGKTDRSLYMPMGPDPQTMGVAEEAGRTGQKEVFDTAMLGSLLKIVRHDSMVDRYMGDLMKGLDRLGRILFLFYWHGEEFEDQYGKQDMPELEDGLRNAFEAVGAIVMALKKKTVEASPEEGMHDSLKDLANN